MPPFVTLDLINRVTEGDIAPSRVTGEITRLMGIILQWFRDELKLYPLVLFSLLVYGGVLYWLGAIDHVGKQDLKQFYVEVNTKIEGIKSDVSALKTGIGELRSTMQFNHLETEMHKTNETIFQMTERVREDKEKHKDTDPFYINRLHELQDLQAEQIRQMNRLESAGISR